MDGAAVDVCVVPCLEPLKTMPSSETEYPRTWLLKRAILEHAIASDVCKAGYALLVVA